MIHGRLTMEGAMKVGLLGTGFGIAHARIYHTHPQVSEVVVFGRTPAKLQTFAEEFGYATTASWASREGGAAARFPVGYESFEHHSAGCSPDRKPAIYRSLVAPHRQPCRPVPGPVR
jgi:hypothetical protein